MFPTYLIEKRTMIQRILLLALMSTQNLHDTRSEYLLIKLDSQSDDIESRTPETVPLATEAPEIVTISAQKASPKFEKKTFQKLNKNGTFVSYVHDFIKNSSDLKHNLYDKKKYPFIC